MSDQTKAHQLLAAALEGAADVARTRLGRDVQLVASDEPQSSAILRFDLPFAAGGRLTWFITNDDATGLSDLLIGGSGDRSAVLTEMHLDALTVAFSDMLSRAVDTMSLGLSEPLVAGEIDLGMEGELPALEHANTRASMALQIDGFGRLAIVSQADADLSQWLDHYGLDGLPQVETAPATPEAAPADAADATAPAADAPPEPAGPAPATEQPAAAAAAPDNVVPLAGTQPAAGRTMADRQGDLEMLMNVPLPLTVELGSTQRTVRELVDFSIGSIIELGKLAGDPLDIKVNDRVIARGEVVVIDEEFGIRVTEIVSPEDRLRGIG